METLTELPHSTDLRFNYVQGVANSPSLWNIEEGWITFRGERIFSNLFDQRTIYNLVRTEENRHEQALVMG